MSTPLLLDTHAWIWLVAGDGRLASFERRFNAAAAARALLLASISVYEAALIGTETAEKRRRGKQAVIMSPTVQHWIRDALALTRVTLQPLEGEQALEAALLHSMHSDPFDRMIVATASSVRATLVTADQKIIAFAEQAGVRVLEV